MNKVFTFALLALILLVAVAQCQYWYPQNAAADEYDNTMGYYDQHAFNSMDYENDDVATMRYQIFCGRCSDRACDSRCKSDGAYNGKKSSVSSFCYCNY